MHIGGGHCGVCWGTCCPLVNTVLNTLVQAGELNDDAEVGVYLLLKCIYYVIIEYPCSHGGIHTKIGESENSC